MARLKREESFDLKCVEQCDSTDDYRPTDCHRNGKGQSDPDRVQIPTSFTAGLLTFAVLLLVGNVVTLWSFSTMMPVYASGLEPYVLVYTWTQSIGLLALAFVSWK